MDNNDLGHCFTACAGLNRTHSRQDMHPREADHDERSLARGERLNSVMVRQPRSPPRMQALDEVAGRAR